MRLRSESKGITARRGRVCSISGRKIPRSAAALKIATSVGSPTPLRWSGVSSASEQAAAASNSSL
jgi:hypothetical protein